MEMTAHEIVRSYKEAKDKKKQVGILAQLNLCTPEDIKKILVEGGINGRELPRGKRTQSPPPQPPNEAKEPTAPSAHSAIIREALKAYKAQTENAMREEVRNHEETMAKFKNDIAEIDRLLQAEQTEGDAQ